MCGYKKTSEQHFCHSDVFPVAPPASLIIYLLPYQRKPNDFRGLLVRVVRLERTVSWSQTRRDTNFAIPGYSFSAIISRRGGKSKIFLSVVIYVVKPAFVPLSATGGKPAIARAAKLCGLLSKPRMDRVYALPNCVRQLSLLYQLFTRFARGGNAADGRNL